MRSNSGVQLEPYGNLLLDPENPRLAGYPLRVADQSKILEWLWTYKHVEELVDSMLAGGYWEHEELFVTPGPEPGTFVVVEGNRRLAAVKVLMEPECRVTLAITKEWSLTEDVRNSLERLPVIVQPREEIWGYVGFKHLNGPQPWDSIAKAKYICRVHEEFGQPLATIASTLGDRNATVVRLYRGYLVLQQALESEIFEIEDRASPKFAFSHLWTALGYSSVKKFLGLEESDIDTRNPVPEHRQAALGELLLWLYGSKSRGRDPLIRSQNPHLRQMAEVLDSDRGLQYLRAQKPLSSALDAARGDERLFRDALTNAESELRSAARLVATGYSGDAALLETGQDAAKVAHSLVHSMKEIGKQQTSDT